MVPDADAQLQRSAEDGSGTASGQRPTWPALEQLSLLAGWNVLHCAAGAFGFAILEAVLDGFSLPVLLICGVLAFCPTILMGGLAALFLDGGRLRFTWAAAFAYGMASAVLPAVLISLGTRLVGDSTLVQIGSILSAGVLFAAGLGGWIAIRWRNRLNARDCDGLGSADSIAPQSRSMDPEAEEGSHSCGKPQGR